MLWGPQHATPPRHHATLALASPCPHAAARGHFELVQSLLEAAVMCEGPEKAKKGCIDHTNAKRQTPLMVACKHGCVQAAWAQRAMHAGPCACFAHARARSTLDGGKRTTAS